MASGNLPSRVKHMTSTPSNEADELTYGIDTGAPNGDWTALTIVKNGKVHTFTGDDADAILAYANTQVNQVLDEAIGKAEMIIEHGADFKDMKQYFATPTGVLHSLKRGKQ